MHFCSKQWLVYKYWVSIGRPSRSLLCVGFIMGAKFISESVGSVYETFIITIRIYIAHAAHA